MRCCSTIRDARLIEKHSSAPFPEVPGSVDVGMLPVAAGSTEELAFEGAIGLGRVFRETLLLPKEISEPALRRFRSDLLQLSPQPPMSFVNLELAERLSFPRLIAQPVRTAVGLLERIAQGGKRSLIGFELHAGDPLPRLILFSNGENGLPPTTKAVGFLPGLL